MPQTLAGVFDEAFDLYKRHFALLAMIVAVSFIPTEILRNIIVAVWLHPLDAHLSGAANANTDSLVLLRIGQFFLGEPRSTWPGFLAILVFIFLSAPVSIAVSDLYFGRSTTVRDCYRRCRSYLLPMMWGYCQVALISIGVLFVGILVILMIAGVVASIFFTADLPEVAGIFFMGLMVLPYFFCCGIFARSFLFVTPLTILEGLPASYVPYRNNQLVGKKRFWRSWAAAVGLPIILACFLAIFNFATDSLLNVLHLPSIVYFIAISARGTGIYFLLAPYGTIFLTLLYYDYRVRREGFDVRLLSLATPETALDKGAES